PGHGDTGIDSHLALPEVTGDMARLRAVELPPFEAMIAAGVPGVMSAHVAFPAVEPGLPATLSKKVLTGLLREELGFEGLIVTDYMDMKAIAENYGPGEAAVRSVAAGADLVLLGPDVGTQRQVYQALLAAVKSGRLPEARVREAVAHSQRVAERYPPRWDDPAPDYAAHKQLAARVATRAATLLWNDGVLPISAGTRVAVVAPQPGGFGRPPHLGDILGRSLAGVTRVAIAERPTDADITAAIAAAESADVVVLGSYHWLGAFPAGLRTLAARLAASGKPLVVVALGNPDDLRFLGVHADAYLAAYGYREANLQGAAALLTGRTEPHGKLPVPAGDYPAGTGMEAYQ
ncbi:MAG TPA: glycoside hydrolase family 3 N-terminal domain-containing protein, partial [Trueperaceae bacterium]